MALDTQFPQWLSNQQAWTREDDSRFTQSLVSDYFEGQKVGMQKQQQQIAMQSNLLGIEQQKQALNLGQAKIQHQTVDNAVIPTWLQQHPTWESRQDAEWPTALTPEGQQTLAQVRLRDVGSVQQKVAIAGVSEFSKRVANLSKSNPIAGAQFAQYIGKVPSPTVLQALSVAEQTVGVQQQNQKEQAALEAQQRGDVATTTINDKGVSTSYKPAPESSKTSEFKPQEPIKLQDGAQLIHVSPNRWQYVKGSTKNDLTPEQKRNVAHELLSLNAKDPRGLAILSELADLSVSKQAPQKTAPSVTAPAKIRKYNPDTGLIE